MERVLFFYSIKLCGASLTLESESYCHFFTTKSVFRLLLISKDIANCMLYYYTPNS